MPKTLPEGKVGWASYPTDHLLYGGSATDNALRIAEEVLTWRNKKVRIMARPVLMHLVRLGFVARLITPYLLLMGRRPSQRQDVVGQKRELKRYQSTATTYGIILSPQPERSPFKIDDTVQSLNVRTQIVGCEDLRIHYRSQRLGNLAEMHADFCNPIGVIFRVIPGIEQGIRTIGLERLEPGLENDSSIGGKAPADGGKIEESE